MSIDILIKHFWLEADHVGKPGFVERCPYLKFGIQAYL